METTMLYKGLYRVYIGVVVIDCSWHQLSREQQCGPRSQV